MRYLSLGAWAREFVDYTYVMDAGAKGESWVLTRDAPGSVGRDLRRTNKEMAWLEPMIAGGIGTRSI